MAWTDQCQIAFKMSAKNIIHKRGGKGVVKTIKTLSRESGIPYKTLESWYYPNKKSILKIQDGYETNSDNNINETDSNDKICPICEIRKRKRQKRNGGWYYYDVCHKCLTEEEEITIKCPHCFGIITMKRKEVL